VGRLLRRFLVLVVALLVMGAPGSAPAASAMSIAGEAVAAADPIQGGATGEDVVVDVDDETSPGDDVEASAEDVDAPDGPAVPIAAARPPALFPPASQRRVRRAIVAPPTVHLEIPKPPPRA
jgi:hypothetical protein